MVDRLSDFNQNFKYSINVNIINKDNEAFKKYNGSFISSESDLEGLLKRIELGQAFSPIVFKDSYRKADNFISSQMLVLDFDGGIGLEEILERNIVKEQACAYYTTPSHRQGENGDRFRVLFLLPESIEDPALYKTCIVNLLKLFPEADQSCKDNARAYYGFEQCEYEIWDKFITQEFFEDLKSSTNQAITQIIKNEKVSKTLSPLSPVITNDEYKQVENILKVIPSQGDYHVWRDIVWSLCSKFSEAEVKSLINSWSPDIKNQGGDLDTLIKRFNGSFNISTLYYYAKAHGYQLPKVLQKKLTPGQVIEEELIKRQAKEIISVAGFIYEYQEEGYYKCIDELKFKRQALDLLSNHVTNLTTGTNDYAKSSAADEAYKYMVSNYSVDMDQINPMGINLAS